MWMGMLGDCCNCAELLYLRNKLSITCFSSVQLVLASRSETTFPHSHRFTIVRYFLVVDEFENFHNASANSTTIKCTIIT